jgi:hypothetical protein
MASGSAGFVERYPNSCSSSRSVISSGAIVIASRRSGRLASSSILSRFANACRVVSSAVRLSRTSSDEVPSSRSAIS